MSFSLAKVQDYRKVPGKNEVRLVGENPYVRFIDKERTAIYLQGGQFFAEGGNLVEPEPWIVAAVKKVKRDKLVKVGLDVDAFENKHGALDAFKPGTLVEDTDMETQQEPSEIRTPRKTRR